MKILRNPRASLLAPSLLAALAGMAAGPALAQQQSSSTSSRTTATSTASRPGTAPAGTTSTGNTGTTSTGNTGTPAGTTSTVTTTTGSSGAAAPAGTTSDATTAGTSLSTAPALNTGHPLDAGLPDRSGVDTTGSNTTLGTTTGTTGNATVQAPTGNLTTLNPAATGGTTLNPLNVPTTLNPNVTTPPTPGLLSPSGTATTLNPNVTNPPAAGLLNPDGTSTTLNPSAVNGTLPVGTTDTLNGSATTLNPALGSSNATTLNPAGDGTTTLNPQQSVGLPGNPDGAVRGGRGVVPSGTGVGANANGVVGGASGSNSMLNTNGVATGANGVGTTTGSTALVRGANGTVITNATAGAGRGNATVRGGIGTTRAGAPSGRELTLTSPTSLLASQDAHADALAQLSNGQVVMVLDQTGDWVHVRTADGSEGWVKMDTRASRLSKGSEMNLQPGGEMVLGETVDLNGKPANSGGVSERAVAGDRIVVLARQGDWLQVRTPAGATGWARESDLVSLHDQIEHRLTMAKDQELHAKPAPGARVVGRVVTGVEVDVLQDSNGWMLVKTPQGQGWIRSNDGKVR